MSLKKDLILDYVKSIAMNKTRLLEALEDLDIEELERFVAILGGVRTKTLIVGQEIYSDKLKKVIIITGNNFVKDKIDYYSADAPEMRSATFKSLFGES